MTRQEQARRRADVLFGLGVLLGVTVVAWLVITMQQLADDLRDANGARDALAEQVQGLGADPVAGPPGSRGEAGEVGEPGPQGPPGDRGPAGLPGRAGTDGADGEQGPAGDPGEPGDLGAAGQSGADGPPGPPGPQGDPGAPGPQGEQGEQGPRGDTGPAGPSGAACPEGYSLQAPVWDPDALVCRRVDAPPPAEPEPPAGLLGAALDPARRQW